MVDDGYNINLGDDDDELFIMSKQKGSKTKATGSPEKGKQGKNNRKTKTIQEEDGGEELNNMHVQPDTNDDYDCDYSQSISSS